MKKLLMTKTFKAKVVKNLGPDRISRSKSPKSQPLQTTNHLITHPCMEVLTVHSNQLRQFLLRIWQSSSRCIFYCLWIWHGLGRESKVVCYSRRFLWPIHNNGKKTTNPTTLNEDDFFLSVYPSYCKWSTNKIIDEKYIFFYYFRLGRVK